MSHPSRERCSICSGPLTVHEAVRGGACSRTECQRRRAVLDATRVADERYERRAGRARAAMHPTSGSEPDAPILPVPAFMPSLETVPAHRRRAFTRRLIGLIRELWTESTRAEADAPDPPQHEAARTDLLSAACAACRGWCCQVGADHGFIDRTVLQHQRGVLPDIDPRRLLALYVQRIPERTCAGSCIFHGESGCALPRAMRSDVCESHVCSDMRRAFRKAPDPIGQRVWLAAINDDDAAPARVLQYEPPCAPTR